MAFVTRASNGNTRSKTKKHIIIVMLIAVVVNALIATLVVASGAEIINLVDQNTDIDASSGLLTASSVLLWAAVFFPLFFIEAVLVFIGWIFIGLFRDVSRSGR